MGSATVDPTSALSMLTWYRRRNRLGDLSAATALLFLPLLVLTVFTLIPLLYSGYLSLIEWDGLSADRPFVGFDNFARLFESPEFGQSVRATLLYTFGVSVGSVAVGLAVALMIGRLSRGQSFYRAVYFLPAVTATVALSVVWKLLLDPGSGYINVALRQVGVQGPNWLRSTTWAMPAIILVGIWKHLGFNVIVFLAGMHTIPKHVFEAAAVDGARSLRLIRSIVLPLLAPIILLLMIVGVIDGFLVFDQIFVMTGGGPVGTTDVLGMLLYRTAFRFFDLGGAAAVGWVMFGLVASITLVQWRLYGTGTRGVG
ncbi:MAG: sugar ABC transporter permease [Acidimicrobiia bacterium]